MNSIKDAIRRPVNYVDSILYFAIDTKGALMPERPNYDSKYV